MLDATHVSIVRVCADTRDVAEFAVELFLAAAEDRSSCTSTLGLFLLLLVQLAVQVVIKRL